MPWHCAGTDVRYGSIADLTTANRFVRFVPEADIKRTIKGKTYCFGNEQAKTDFMKDADGNLAKAQSYYSTKHPG